MSLAKTSLLAIQNECFKQTGLQELQLPDSTKYFDSSAVPDDCKLVINKTRYSQLLDDYRWRLAAYNSYIGNLSTEDFGARQESSKVKPVMTSIHI